jgi:cytochrome c oxidase subunit IV
MAHPTTAVYYKVFAALLVLLAATVAIAEFDLGPWNFPAAAAIATAKGLLIVLFFMHVRYSPPLTWLFAGAGFFWLGILIVLTYSDYATRATDAPPRTQPPPSRSTNSPTSRSNSPIASSGPEQSRS